MTDTGAAPSTAQTREFESDFERLLQKTFSPREILDGDSLDKMMRIAEQLARSALSVPKHLRDNVGDCLAIVTQAMLWNMNPFAVAQKTHLVNGTLGYEAQLVNAVLQNSGAVRGLPQYEYRGEGNGLECRVGFVPRGETQVVFGEWLRSGDITTKNSPLWKTNPRQQLGYLQIKNWARAFVPGAILGVYTVDELEDNLMGRDAPTVDAPPPGPRRKSESTPPPAPAAKVDQVTGEISPPPAPPAPTPAPRPAAPPAAAPAAGGISGGQVAYLRNKLRAASVDEATICDRFQVTSIELLNGLQFDELKAELLQMV
ncbi:MAG: hypothetical protein PVS3B2_00020 [Candidatus Dormibacteraceae bacterium]